MAPFSRIVIQRKVLRCAVIPDGDTACCPLEAARELRLRNMFRQIVDQRFALCRRHIFETCCVGPAYVEGFLASIRMRANNRMHTFEALGRFVESPFHRIESRHRFCPVATVTVFPSY